MSYYAIFAAYTPLGLARLQNGFTQEFYEGTRRSKELPLSVYGLPWRVTSASYAELPLLNKVLADKKLGFDDKKEYPNPCWAATQPDTSNFLLHENGEIIFWVDRLDNPIMDSPIRFHRPDKDSLLLRETSFATEVKIDLNGVQEHKLTRVVRRVTWGKVAVNLHVIVEGSVEYDCYYLYNAHAQEQFRKDQAQLKRDYPNIETDVIGKPPLFIE